MCGIAGVLHRDGRQRSDPSSLVDSLSTALAHRGPDGSGAWISTSTDVVLVHRRLAIIDPGRDGAQPMTVDGGRTVIVFNGEIYNYRELRRELEAAGQQFQTRSDTEVLLRMVGRHGPSALTRLRGMFAFALWDAYRRSLLLARDRFGIKPLYLAQSRGSLAFASELRALRAAKLVDSAPAPAAVLGFLAWGSVPPPLAWNRGAEMLPPGSWLEWRQDGRELRGFFADAREPYKSAARPPRRPRDFCAVVGEAVRDSVRMHLVADVPVGVFLSGGVDSGAIVSAAVSAGAHALQTFTVGFDGATSEASRARLVASSFGTKHHELHVAGHDVVRDLPAVIAHLDQPTIDAVNSFYVSRAVAATGIKAVLSGVGGDELFAGYPSFRRLPRALAIRHAAGPAWPVIAAIGRHVLPRRLQPRWRHFTGSNGSMAEAYRVQRGFLLPEELDTVAGPALLDACGSTEVATELERAEQSLLSPAADENPAAAVARLESRFYLQSQLLRDIDAMSMAHSLEVRVPFVDHELVSVVWPELGRHRSLRVGKHLLHSTLARPLPDAVVRHPKQGFTLPFAAWMRAELAPFVQDGLRRLASGGWIDPAAPKRIWDDWLAGRAHWSRPWGLGLLGEFLST
jgi:asparagine synthase (glutamine-hydrolysing)